ncbi:MAG: NAD(+) diphosphatase [Pseudohongiella sp.]|nr:NAD(+) diphosphatase [Pseudohongiella sp.]
MTTSQEQIRSLTLSRLSVDYDPSAVLIVFYENAVVLKAGPDVAGAGVAAETQSADALLWTFPELEDVASCVSALIPIDAGLGSENALYAALLESWPAELPKTQAIPTRQFLFERGFEAFSIVGRASQWINWYRSHRFCGACGSQNAVQGSGALLRCLACEIDYYPRINPCIIVLVTDKNKVLLARSSRRGATFFSCLAGFIEPGETAEEAVAREVYEEAGIQVTNIRYVKSQPWPFPSQLMLGYYADYAGGDLNPCPEELAEAGWFDVDALPSIPAPSISVAGQLIEDYCRWAINKTLNATGES